ncbi:MAG: dihydroorotate dehydrogenase electron transfer subunit [Thermodesulfobacteriota bacterium]|nr:dihydroorotate dehydrogenase electron transfer subunit [Thermodesulfobacteriota bacterium]
MKSYISATVFSQRETVGGHFLVVLKVPDSFRESLPGQFVMVRMKSCDQPFLSRPFSIYSVYSHGKNTFLEILYKVVGKGTEAFSRLREGDILNILGPLGKGFDIPSECDKIVLIAGGVGIAPLSFLAERCEKDTDGAEIVCYIGAGSLEALVSLDRIEGICSVVKISTDDGSWGHAGPVTELFRRDMELYMDNDSRIYSCGPNPMLRSLNELLEGRPVACQVSLEERMACGIGACLGCVVKIKSGDAGSSLVRVCKEGPVFDISSVDFSEHNG